MKLEEFVELLDFHGKVEKVFLSPTERRELYADKETMTCSEFRAGNPRPRFFVCGIEIIRDENIDGYSLLMLKCPNCRARSYKNGRCIYCGK